jgi:hypothetical protein
MFRHSKIPWDALLGASGRVILHHHGITAGSLLIDDTDNPRSKAAHTLAHLYKLRDEGKWGRSLGTKPGLSGVGDPENLHPCRVYLLAAGS